MATAQHLSPDGGTSGIGLTSTSLFDRLRSGPGILAHSRRRIIVGILVIFALLAVGGFFFHGNKTSISYRMADVTKGSIASVISASGTLRPSTQISVVAQAPGQIAAVLADYNSTVKAGEVLARLSSDVAEARLQMAKADLEVARGAVEVARGTTERAMRDVDNARATLLSAKSDVERADLSLGDANSDLKRKQELARTGDAAKVETERAKSAFSQAGASVTSAKAHQTAAAAALASAEAAATVAQAQEKNAVAALASHEASLQQAQIDFDQTFIRAPMDGVVIDRNATVGQAVGAGAGAPPMFIIANDLHQLEVHASIDEADIGRVSVGQTARFGFDAFPGEQFAGKVIEIHKTPQVVQSVVSYDVVLVVANSDLKLLPGMTADVRIIAGEHDNVLKVPNAALRFHPEGGLAEEVNGDAGNPGANTPTVWRLDSHGKPQPESVHTGLSDGAETEIVAEHLSAGDKVITGRARSQNDRPSVGPLKF